MTNKAEIADKMIKGHRLYDDDDKNYFVGIHTLKPTTENKKMYNINVDGDILVALSVDITYRRGYLEYFDLLFDDGRWLSVYIPADVVLDGDILYTKSRVQRRYEKVRRLQEATEQSISDE